jgi:hypothetical protein
VEVGAAAQADEVHEEADDWQVGVQILLLYRYKVYFHLINLSKYCKRIPVSETMGLV